jgi:hypothetical protein
MIMRSNQQILNYNQRDLATSTYTPKLLSHLGGIL